MKYYENQSRFNGVYSRDNLPNKIKDGAYVINLDEYSDIGTHWIALYVKNNDITYFDSFGVEHIPKEIKTFIKNKNVMTNIFRINTSEFNKLAANVFNARIAEALITKTDFDAKLSSLNRKITNNKSKHLLNENELNKLKTFDSSYFHGKNYFNEDGNQNYYIFQPISKYLKVA